MDAARKIVAMLTLRKRAAAGNVARATRDCLDAAVLAIFEAQYIEADLALQLTRDLYSASRGDKSQRQHVVSTSERRDEFITLSDGSVYFWPTGSPHGALASWHLRVLADELDRRNQAWDSDLRKLFG